MKKVKQNSIVKQITVQAIEVEVWKDGVRVGTGKVAYSGDGTLYVASFYDKEENILLDDFYDIVQTSKTWLEVVPEWDM